MASRFVSSIVHDMDWLPKDVKSGFSYDLRKKVAILKLNLKFLETFIMYARKWKNKAIYFESNDGKMVSLQSFLSSIEATINKHGRDTCSISLRSKGWHTDLSRLEKELEPVVSKFLENVKSFKQDIIEGFSTLAGLSIWQSTSCMRDIELVKFIDSLLQNLVDLLSIQYFEYKDDYDTVLHAQIEALEDKLTFLKNIIRFAKLCGIKHRQLDDLLTHAKLSVLYAAQLSYMCLFYKEDEEVRNPKMCSLISDLLQKIKPVHIRVCEIYSKVLKASNSSLSSHTKKLDMHIVQDFNDSLISNLWELLCCSTGFLVSVKGQMQILYEGLRFLRSILRNQHEKMDVPNQKIVAVIGNAGIVICSLFVKEVDVDSIVIRNSPDFCAMLDGTNNNIELIKSQISGSSVTASIRSHHRFKGQEGQGRKISRSMPSKGIIPINHEVVVGFDDEAETLVNRLVHGSDSLEIIPIVGMPGLGKTTLAKKVYSDSCSLTHFHVRLWCTVSQVYNRKSLLLQILCCDGKHSGVYKDLTILDEHDLLKELYQKLKKNMYLVVFDDVWDIRVWNDLKSAFPNDKNRSRILFTSRQENVLSKIEYGVEPHYLRQLTDEKSWELLRKKMFGNENCPQAMHEIGMKIAKNCKGLPLAVVFTAGILATMEYDGWVEFAESLKSTTLYDDDQCQKTVELSYAHLPQYLKPCLLYFGAFREDQEIQSKKLMWLWIAEGFVKDADPKGLEDLAEQYMMDLIGRNLVMAAKQRSIGGVKACRIHDLLHEFCKAKAKEENFLQVLRGYDELSTFNEPPDLDRLSIWSKAEHFKKSRLFCPHVSSLLLSNQIEESEMSKSLMVDISFVFRIFKGLRVLDLEQIILRHKVFPSEVESLVELRYLGVQGKIRVIPPSIANLSNLETFRVITYYTISLPAAMWNMTKLRHLYIEDYIPGYSVCYSFPSENLEDNAGLLNLDTFSTLAVSLDRRVESILEKIPNVRKLKIQLPKAKEFTTTGHCNMSGLERLESLKVSAKSTSPNHVEFFFPSTLKKLVLVGLRQPWSKIQLIEELPNLEVLKLLYMSFVGEKWVLKKGRFLKLRFLGMYCLDVVEWTDEDEDEDEESDDYFPCLEKLFLSRIQKLKMVPSCLKLSTTLEVIEVRHCKDSVKELVREIEESQEYFAGRHLRIIE